ncbi:Uncharacterised protein [Buttiauxella agrestis]|uniref:Uncharacterized protein n=1 Tax=Buttiauxella agrestis TaxID=82977 RepID=A0A381C867_9ENTR|nr:Uncharacterised protein [Buttiauxella agrestis]
MYFVSMNNQQAINYLLADELILSMATHWRQT